MFERFTDRARKVMALANQEAQRLNHEYIGTEHILLGLVKEGSGVGANVLKNCRVELRKVRLEVAKLVQAGPEMVTMGKLPQTPRARRVVEYSLETARELGHNYVGTEHLLLALIREQDGVAAQVLMNLGLTLENVRLAVLDLIGDFKDRKLAGLRAASAPVVEADSDSEERSSVNPIDDMREGILSCLWRVEQLREAESQLVTEKAKAVVACDYELAAELRDRAEALNDRIRPLNDYVSTLQILTQRLDEIRREFPLNP